MQSTEKTSLKKGPKAIIGNAKRQFLGTGNTYPAANQYSSHLDMTDRRSNSRERNAPRATIGNMTRHPASTRNNFTPAPDTYNIQSQATIGDQASVKVCFATQIRPISARPG